MSNNYLHIKKKVRGARRKYNLFISRLKYYTEYFPELDNDIYWHIHMPCSDLLLNSPKSPSYVKEGCKKIIIERTRHLINIKPASLKNTKVVGVIDLRNLWDSQIIIFNNHKYFKQFFERDDEYQTWKPITDDYKVTYLHEIKDMSVRGYNEIIKEDGDEYLSELWFVGELD